MSRYTFVVEFSTAHVWGDASLSDPYWVCGAAVWGACLALVAGCLRGKDGRWRPIAVGALVLMVVGSRIGSSLAANLLMAPHASNSFSGGAWGLAVPIGLVLHASRSLQPRLAALRAWARGIVLLAACYAAWALAILPGEYLQIRGNLQYRQVFYENIAIVPILAVFGAVALLTTHNTAGVFDDRASFRGWLLSCGEGIVALFVTLAQLWFVNRAACPLCRPFKAPTYALIVLGIVVLEAARRSRSMGR